MIGLTFISVKLYKRVIFSKTTRSSLPLKKTPPLFSVFFNSLYAPFGSPGSGGQKPQGKRGNRSSPSLLTASL